MPSLRQKFLKADAAPLGTEKHVFSRLQDALAEHAGTDATKVAQSLILSADKFVKSEIPFMGIAPFMTQAGIESRYEEPQPYYDRWAESNFAFVDPADGQLPAGEARNEVGTRRATLTGIEYGSDANSLPQNPYLETSGIKGRFGAQFGNNTTVDIIPFRVTQDADGFEVLEALEIINGDGHPANIGGYVETKAGADGKHVRDAATIFNTKLKEFFEEAVSGSIPLLPEYEAKLDEYAGPPAERPAKAKWDQVAEHDQGFLTRLETMLSADHIAFEGPILLSPGTTDNCWGETSLSWFMIANDDWNKVVGDKPAFEYDFIAGDDALDVNFVALNAASVAATHTPHRAFKAYALADYILQQQAKGDDFAKSHILDQARDITAYFERQEIVNKAKPIPTLT
jgi:hypothetical protein